MKRRLPWYAILGFAFLLSLGLLVWDMWGAHDTTGLGIGILFQLPFFTGLFFIVLWPLYLLIHWARVSK